MRRDLIYSNAIAKYNETKLLKKEQFIRLINASDYDEALKMLYDYGYARAATNDLDKTMTAQINALNAYVIEDCPSEKLLKIILNPYCYNNAKLYYKSAFLSVDENAFYALDDDIIKKGITEKQYALLPPEMKKCAEELDKRAPASPLDGRLIDIMFNRAQFKDDRDCAFYSMRGELRRFVATRIDLTNFVTFYRCRKLNKAWEFCKEMLYEGGKITAETLEKIYGADDKEVKEAFEKHRYGGIIEKMLDGRIHPDMGIDSALIETSLQKILNMTSLSPFLSYYYRQLVEYRVVKMILTCIKNNARGEIEKRMRGIYED